MRGGRWKDKEVGGRWERGGGDIEGESEESGGREGRE